MIKIFLTPAVSQKFLKRIFRLGHPKHKRIIKASRETHEYQFIQEK